MKTLGLGYLFLSMLSVSPIAAAEESSPLPSAIDPQMAEMLQSKLAYISRQACAAAGQCPGYNVCDTGKGQAFVVVVANNVMLLTSGHSPVRFHLRLPFDGPEAQFSVERALPPYLALPINNDEISLFVLYVLGSESCYRDKAQKLESATKPTA